METWLRDPDFRPGLSTLCDFSEATSTPTVKELREIGEMIAEHAAAVGKKKRAMIAPKRLPLGVARQFQTLADFGPLEVGVFKDRPAALDWLCDQEPRP